MKNYEMVAQWAATLNAEKAHREITALVLKYPWMKCPETLAFVDKMMVDLPKIANIVKHQEKQNMIHRKYIEVNNLADEAIVKAIASQYNIKI